jgi:predicted nucleic acid-binding protein
VALLLLDTNILIRALHPADPDNPGIRTALRACVRAGYDPCFTSQNLVEGWRVMTGAAGANGWGFSIADSDTLIQKIVDAFSRLPDDDQVLPTWRRLIVDFNVVGMDAHDARIAAVMLTQDVSVLLTRNRRDFSRFASLGIVALTPEQVVTGGLPE